MPTEAQFKSNPRARNLRNSSLMILRTMAHGKKTPEELALLRQNRTRLIDMGIEANMNAGRPESAYEDPVFMAEYVAGQIIASVPEDFEMDRILFHGVRNTAYRFLDAE